MFATITLLLYALSQLCGELGITAVHSHVTATISALEAFCGLSSNNDGLTLFLTWLQIDVAIWGLALAAIAFWIGFKSLQNANHQLGILISENQRRSSEICLFEDFKDPVLRSYLRMMTLENTDIDGGVPPQGLTQQELSSIKVLRLKGLPIHTLEGIEMLSSLEILICDSTLVKTINVIGLTKLEEIHASHCEDLEDIYCQKCEVLKILKTDYSPVKHLKCSQSMIDINEISSKGTLETIECRQVFSDPGSSSVGVEPMKKLDLTKFSSIKSVDCSDNCIDEIICSEIIPITSLKAEGNSFFRLDLTNMPQLELLICTTPPNTDSAQFGKSIKLRKGCNAKIIFK